MSANNQRPGDQVGFDALTNPSSKDDFSMNRLLFYFLVIGCGALAIACGTSTDDRSSGGGGAGGVGTGGAGNGGSGTDGAAGSSGTGGVGGSGGIGGAGGIECSTAPVDCFELSWSFLWLCENCEEHKVGNCGDEANWLMSSCDRGRDDFDPAYLNCVTHHSDCAAAARCIEACSESPW